MNHPERKDIRLKNYDYSRNGRYFITICTADKNYCLSEFIAVPYKICSANNKWSENNFNETNRFHDMAAFILRQNYPQ